MGTVIQEGELKGEIPVLPNFGFVAEVMPVSMATELGLSLQAVDPNKYKLASANGSPIAIQFKSTFTLEISPSKISSSSVLYQTLCPLKTLSCHGGPFCS